LLHEPAQNLPFDPSEVIFKASDVILAEIIACLNLNEHKIFCPDILYPVPIAAADIDRLAVTYFHNFVIAGENGLAVHNEPVLGPFRMALEAQALPRENGYTFHFMVICVNKVLKVTPWAV
jgi:hypothetical protein